VNHCFTGVVARRLGRRREGLERQFIPKETLAFPKGSFVPTMDENMARSLDLFIETLSSVEHTDTRISTKPGRVEFADEYQEYRVIWILNVIDSIYMAANDDPHVSIRAISTTPSGQYYTSRMACVFTGNLPVGDYLANVVLMFHNNIMVDQINTLNEIRREVLNSVKKAERAEAKEAEREAHRQALLEAGRLNRERRAQRSAERAERESKLVEAGVEHLIDNDGHFWPNFYEQMIAQDVGMIVRKWALVELDKIDRDELRFAIDKLYEIDCDSEPNFPGYQREWLLRDLIVAPICPDARINMIHRLRVTDNIALRNLDPLRDELERGIGDHGDVEGRLLNATREAIDRIRGRHYERMFASARRRRQ
jgi:hypothetical protein